MYLTVESTYPRASSETTVLLNSHWWHPCVRDEKTCTYTCNHKPSPSCLWVWEWVTWPENPGSYLCDSGVLGNWGAWGGGNALASFSAMSGTFRRNRCVWAGAGAADRELPRGWSEKDCSSGPWISLLEWQAPGKELGACHKNQEEYLWSEAWGPNRRALKWDLKGIK